MMKKICDFGIVIMLCLSLKVSLSSQETFLIDTMKLSITGTSTLHDWKVDINEVIDYPEYLVISEDGTGQIEEFEFMLAVASMDGGRGAAMNNKIYKALKAETHPHISYVQSGPAEYIKTPDGKLNIKSVGMIKIAGVEVKEEVPIIGVFKESKLSIVGTCPLKMSDFGIEPPSAMFGQIQTDDEIEVHFKLIYKKGE